MWIGDELLIVGHREGTATPLHIFDAELKLVRSFGRLFQVPEAPDSSRFRWGVGIAGRATDSSFLYVPYTGGDAEEYSTQGPLLRSWSIQVLEATLDREHQIDLPDSKRVVLDMFPRTTGVAALSSTEVITFKYDPGADATTIAVSGPNGSTQASGAARVPMYLVELGLGGDAYVVRWINGIELVRYRVTKDDHRGF